jgi:hypothetical protein
MYENAEFCWKSEKKSFGCQKLGHGLILDKNRFLSQDSSVRSFGKWVFRNLGQIIVKIDLATESFICY